MKFSITFDLKERLFAHMTQDIALRAAIAMVLR